MVLGIGARMAVFAFIPLRCPMTSKNYELFPTWQKKTHLWLETRQR